MARKIPSKPNRRKSPKPPQNSTAKNEQAAEPPDREETRGAVALTVAWMLTMMATIAAGLTACAALGVAHWVYRPPHPAWDAVGRVFWLVAALVGTLCLIFAPLAYMARKRRPPELITALAAVIGIIPWIVVVYYSSRS